MFKTKYRIRRDAYAGYGVQVWRWWWPFWYNFHSNTRHSITEAEYLARQHMEIGRVVKVLD